MPLSENLAEPPPGGYKRKNLAAASRGQQVRAVLYDYARRTLRMTGVETLCQRRLTDRSLHARLTRGNGARKWGVSEVNAHGVSTSFYSCMLAAGPRGRGGGRVECPEGGWSDSVRLGGRSGGI